MFKDASAVASAFHAGIVILNTEHVLKSMWDGSLLVIPIFYKWNLQEMANES